MLLMLTRSRTVARVRPAHLLRAGVYQLAIFIPVYGLLAADAICGASQSFLYRTIGIWQRPLNWLMGAPLPLFAAAMLAWFAWYWYEAIVRGLQLQRGRLIWAMLMVAAGLLAFIAAMNDRNFWRLIGWW
jgi:hypothetical protein